MSATKERKDFASSDDENLPLYPQLQYSHPETAPVPPATATPAEVRDYLAALLRNKHNLPEDRVQQIVSRWTLGTGHELWCYPAQMFLSIFGHEEGWTLYREVKLDLYRGMKKPKQTFWWSNGIWILLAASFMFMSVDIMVLMSNYSQRVTAVAAFFLTFGVAACIASIIVVIVGTSQNAGLDPPEKVVEQKLQACTMNTSPCVHNAASSGGDDRRRSG